MIYRDMYRDSLKISWMLFVKKLGNKIKRLPLMRIKKPGNYLTKKFH